MMDPSNGAYILGVGIAPGGFFIDATSTNMRMVNVWGTGAQYTSDELGRPAPPGTWDNVELRITQVTATSPQIVIVIRHGKMLANHDLAHVADLVDVSVGIVFSSPGRAPLHVWYDDVQLTTK